MSQTDVFWKGLLLAAILGAWMWTVGAAILYVVAG